MILQIEKLKWRILVCKNTQLVRFTNGNEVICRLVGHLSNGQLAKVTPHRKAKKCTCSDCKQWGRFVYYRATIRRI